MRRSLLALLAAVLLTACNQGGDEQGSAPATAAPNDADVTFTQNMIPHHQAIEMAELVDTRTSRPELRTLADRIATSQGRETSLLQGWLKAWGKPAAPPGMDHGGMHMPGMMSEAQMRQLTATRQQDFNLMFLQMMTAHHQGAIQMANTELRDGSLPEVKRLAQQIIDDQQAEIDQFQQWQKEWATASIR